MPKPNQTMLDKLAETFKSMGKPAPFREMKLHGEFTDPMIKAQVNQKLAGNKIFKLDPSWRTPERVKYQRGIEARLYPKKVAADSELYEANREVEELEDEWNTGVENAKEDMMEDWRSTLDYEDFSDIDPDYLEVETPSTDLRDFWSDRNPEEIYADYGQAQERAETAQDRYDYIYSPRAVMDEQMMTPRYRRYQQAMRQREENARLGRLNAAIMNLYRQGYSMPEIREILRSQRIR